MAVIPVTAIRKGNWLHFSWETVANGDTCEPAYLNHNVSDMFIEVSGTFTGPTLITVNGGVISSALTPLVDPGNAAISLGAAGGSAIRDAWPFIKPVETGGTAGMDVDIEIRMKVA
ncbi:MAG: hypothetical protein ACXACE_15060 [Candidatus Thorarchaeota archaeon]|jgi:hypothetical protein